MIVDFRARPNTAEYMKDYRGPDKAAMWQRFGVPEPAVGTLATFAGDLSACGIDRAVFTGRQVFRDGLLVKGVSNDYVAACVSAYPEQLVGIAGADPTTGDACVDEVKRAVTELALRGVSIDCAESQVSADHRSLYPLYETAVGLGVPVIFTMGPMTGQWGDPAGVDRVAGDFPDLQIVCSHGTWPQTYEFLGMAFRRSNVYLETSIYVFFPGARIPLGEAMQGMLQDRIIYASAFPFNPLQSIDRFLSEFRLTDDIAEKVMGANALRVLGFSR